MSADKRSGFSLPAAGSVVVGPYEFFQIPGDDENHTIFYIFALSTWAFMLTAYYYGYGAMHHHNERRESDLLAVESSIAVMRQPYVRPEKDNSIATSTTLEATSTTEDAIADVDGVEITNSYGHVDY